MGSLKLVVPGVGSQGDGLTPIRVRPYALYCLGSALVEGTAFNVGDDLVGGLPLTRTGANNIDHGEYATVSPTDYFTTPFTQAQLNGANLGFTVVAVARGPGHNTGATLVTSYQAGSQLNAFTIEMQNFFLARSVIQPGPRVATLPKTTDLDRGNRFSIYAGSVIGTRTRINEKHAQSLRSTIETSYAAQDMAAGIGKFTIGARPVDNPAAVPAGLDVPLIGFWPGELTAEQYDTIIFPDIADWMNFHGLNL